MRCAYVYMMSNKSHRLYVGIAADLLHRVTQHKEKLYPNGFTARYNFDRLVWFESAESLRAAAQREKQLKGWIREKKIALIQSKNPKWLDLSQTWTELLRGD